MAKSENHSVDESRKTFVASLQARDQELDAKLAELSVQSEEVAGKIALLTAEKESLAAGIAQMENFGKAKPKRKKGSGGGRGRRPRGEFSAWQLVVLALHQRGDAGNVDQVHEGMTALGWTTTAANPVGNVRIAIGQAKKEGLVESGYLDESDDKRKAAYWVSKDGEKAAKKWLADKEKETKAEGEAA